jgi:periplasmic protein CpxP/Spy
MRWIGFFAAGVIGALAGNTLFSVASADRGGRGPGHGGFFRHHGGDPEQMQQHAQLAVEMAFRAAGASDDQRAQARGIVTRHLEGAKSLHERHLANRQEGAKALAGSTVDREKLESVRQAQIEIADEASKKLTVALADLAEVLTPEQREELLELGARFHH